MIRRPIAGTDLAISPLGLGTVKIGRDKGVKYPHSFKIPDDRQVSYLISLAKELGVNLIDTAPAYGNSEQRLGPLLQGQRQDWVICSKVGEEFDLASGESHFDFTPEHMRFSLERSLQRLQTDYIDMLLVHSNGDDVDIIKKYGVFEQLNEFKKEGKVRVSGMSTKTVAGGLLALEQSDCAMITYNLAHTEEKPVLAAASQQNKAILLKKALASGHICTDPTQDPVQASFDFIFAHPGTTAAIIGTINPEHLKDNIAKATQAIHSSSNI